jgi:hypothetical protein
MYSLAQHVSALISHHQVRSTPAILLDCFDIISTAHYTFLLLNSTKTFSKIFVLNKKCTAAILGAGIAQSV